jgi:hypothetical protein
LLGVFIVQLVIRGLDLRIHLLRKILFKQMDGSNYSGRRSFSEAGEPGHDNAAYLMPTGDAWTVLFLP